MLKRPNVMSTHIYVRGFAHTKTTIPNFRIRYSLTPIKPLLKQSKPLTWAADWRQPITSALLIYSILCHYLICLSWVKLVCGVRERILMVRKYTPQAHVKRNVNFTLFKKNQNKTKKSIFLSHIFYHLSEKQRTLRLSKIIDYQFYILSLFLFF